MKMKKMRGDDKRNESENESGNSEGRSDGKPYYHKGRTQKYFYLRYKSNCDSCAGRFGTV